jgi:hypothetical protein
MAVPTITGIAPSAGTIAGGNPVVISGVNFNNPAVTSVTFGGTAATFTVNSDSQITATMPAHAAGAVTVTVANSSGSGTSTYTYRTGLTLVPTSGGTGGGTTVDIYGAVLSGTTAVRFGTKPATSFTQLSSAHLQAVSPAGSGTAGVTVTTPGGTSGAANFYYLNPPSKISATPTAGPMAGGTAVTVSGTNLLGATSVTFGGNAGTITTNTAGSLTVTTPAAITMGPAAIVVTTRGGSTNGLTFTYTAAPTITGLTPTSGTTVGGDTVTVTGTELGSTTQVTFGGTPASFQAGSDTQLVVTTPAHAAGVVDVVVTSPGGTATATAAYTYQTPPS